MVFFSAERRRPGLSRYSFVAALCVERKISHAELWADKGPFRGYLNLLIRPLNEGWEHYEPGQARKDWHKDWLWRIAATRGSRKAAVERAGLDHHPGDSLPYPLAENYVVFSSELQARPRAPVLVATHSGPPGREVWVKTPEARAIRRAVFGESDRGLRTLNRQQPHRHFRRSLDRSENLLTNLRAAVRDGS
jgi:hypothetical protein